MTSWQDISMAVGGALALGWGIFVEWRLRQAKDATTILRRSFEDLQATDSVKALSNNDLRSELAKDIGSKHS